MLILALLWIMWCILHSLLITATLNNWFKRKGGMYLGLYRMGYILFAVLSLLPIIWYQYELPQKLLFSWSGYLRLPQVCLLTYAMILFRSGMNNYDTKYFLGLTQWRDYKQGRPTRQLPFRCSGALQYVRHPWYSGGLALLWALGPITDISLLSKVILSVYLIVGSFLEERKLTTELGEVYRNYRRHVPMLIPWKGKVHFSMDVDP